MSTAPTVTSITPPYGKSDGGTAVIITGTNFTETATVKFGTTTATTVHYVSDTQLAAVTPAGTGTVEVTVTTPTGTNEAGSGSRFGYETMDFTITFAGTASSEAQKLAMRDVGIAFLLTLCPGGVGTFVGPPDTQSTIRGG